MKKILAFVLFISLLFSLFGCDPGYCYFTYETEEVLSVELIYYDNNSAKELFEQRDKVKNFDFSKATAIDTLPEDKIDGFLSEFSEIMFLYVWRHLDSPKGKCVKINEADGSFAIICLDGEFSCRYDSSGNVIWFIGSGGGTEVAELIERYLN